MLHYFFDDITSIHRVTLELPAHPEQFRCARCQCTDQFVSHGFVYKKQAQGQPRAVGKRIFCSNLRRHRGCGATLRLSLAEVLPDRHYPASVFEVFLVQLLFGASIAAAYSLATGTQEPRHAYRWLQRWLAVLPVWRTLLGGLPDADATTPFARRCRRLRLLLPTLAALRQRWDDRLVRHWQRHCQTPFLGSVRPESALAV